MQSTMKEHKESVIDYMDILIGRFDKMTKIAEGNGWRVDTYEDVTFVRSELVKIKEAILEIPETENNLFSPSGK